MVSVLASSVSGVIWLACSPRVSVVCNMCYGLRARLECQWCNMVRMLASSVSGVIWLAPQVSVV